jgi:molecular chaperone GrpE
MNNMKSGGSGPEVKVVDKRWWARDTSSGAAENAESVSSLKPTYVEELERQLADKDAQIREYIAKYRGASEEFEQSRARLRREIGKEIERGRRALLLELLDVLDNLDRAVDAARVANETGTLLQGVEMVQAQFLSKLQGAGVLKVRALGAAFDPGRHEAVTTVPVTDPSLDGTVVGVITEGYAIGDDVLRPAMVAVGKLEQP